MKICVTSQADRLDSQVDPRFGRCQYFIFVDTETLNFEAVKNPNVDAMGGAGIRSAQFVAGKGVKTVLTGNIGPNAFQTLQAAGLEVITDIAGTVKETIDRYAKEEFKSTKAPNVDSKFGAGKRGRRGV